MSWKGFTDFKQECVTSWTKLFATNEVQFTDNAIDNFLAFVDYMSCSADTCTCTSATSVKLLTLQKAWAEVVATPKIGDMTRMRMR